MPVTGRVKFGGVILGLVLLLGAVPGRPAAAEAAGPDPVLLGIDAEFGYRGSTSAEAIACGVRIAVEEINAAGGVLGGRPLEVTLRANNSATARTLANLEELADLPEMVAVFGGRFSPPVIAALPLIHEKRLIFLDPWAAADPITENGYDPNYVFRLSLRDGYAMPVMIAHARRQGAQRLGLLLLNTSWGRSNLAAAHEYLGQATTDVKLVGDQWFNWQDTTIVDRYLALVEAGAEGIVMVTNTENAATLVQEVAALPESRRRPIYFHWGVTGGDFEQRAGAALNKLDTAVVQTFSFIGRDDPLTRRVLAAANRLCGYSDARTLPSPVGLAHAYDLTRILARAIERAGTTDRPAVRRALEEVRDYRGLVRFFARPFAPGRHDALEISDVFMARYDPADHAIVPIP